LPTAPSQALIFQSALLFLVLGSNLVDAKFTKPSDAFVHSVSCIIALVGTYDAVKGPIWWVVAGYCAIVFTSAVLAMTLYGRAVPTFVDALSKNAYRIATLLGESRVIFSVVFLFAVWSYYQVRSVEAAVLVVAWALYIVAYPLQLHVAIARLFRKNENSVDLLMLGRVTQIETPSLVRIAVESGVSDERGCRAVCMADGTFQLGVECPPFFGRPLGSDNA
jgi:hypothetical protein